MPHFAVEAVAYQETLLLMAVFGVAILVMIWAGFRRWIDHRMELGRLIADQAAQRSIEQGAVLQRVEARLDAIERLMVDGGAQVTAEIGDLTTAGEGRRSTR